MKHPRRSKWTDIYPVGTTEGNEEQLLFQVLARNPHKVYFGIHEIHELTKLSKSRIEEILQKYHAFGMVYSKTMIDFTMTQWESENKWAYWERVVDNIPVEQDSISTEDHKSRTTEYLVLNPHKESK